MAESSNGNGKIWRDRIIAGLLGVILTGVTMHFSIGTQAAGNKQAIAYMWPQVESCQKKQGELERANDRLEQRIENLEKRMQSKVYHGTYDF